MSHPVIQVDRLSKQYRLGVVGTGTLSHDLNRWWARMRGRPDPTRRVDLAAQSQAPELARGGFPESIWAVREVSFEVRQGEILGIIGRNGAGKSTLLKMLSRVTAPTEGEFRLRGRVASLLEVGTGFHPELTGRENIFLNGAILGMTRAEIRAKFDEIVDFGDVAQFIDTPVKRYSSGMYVRLAFAVAAHLEPEILIVDEVLAVGDARFQDKCLRKMDEVSRSGRTILLVSHNMVSVSSLCSRCLLIEKGRLVLNASPEEAVTRYLRGERESEGKVDLSHSPHRQGSGGARVVEARLLDSTGESSNKFLMGGPLAIQFRVRFEPPGRKAVFALTLANLQGVRLVNWISTDSQCPVGHYVGDVCVTATLPNVPFYPGSYAVERLWVGDPTFRDCYDEVHPLLSFNIVQSPHSVSQRRFHPRLGLVDLAVTATVESLSDGRV